MVKDNHFKNKGLRIAGMVHLSGAEALAEARAGALFIDLRAVIETDYKKFDVPEVLYIPAPELKSRLAELSRDRPLIIADSVGLRSKEAVRYLMEQGYANAANLNGGILDWEHDGLPLKIDDSKKLSGSCTCRLKPQGK
ncbi:rhodanese-like domain-containing protein [candidate division TA06 bacterium]|uniref:Rhodanese-like domain-containing protein n=1 Tax=candidate division TA06 bacterium TaxID=2250710 RepID=A0A933IAE6_UNCT6|nr:rhodanese-like domain-containing protein [candidate division TA06 bacterium]